MRAALILLAICVGLAGTAHAQGKSVRHPETGSPYLSLTLPDSWSSQVDPSGNLIIFNVATTAGFSITVAQDSGTLDALAAGSMQVAKAMPPSFAGSAMLAPAAAGNLYYSAIETAAGPTLNLRMTLVRIDPTHIASVTMLTKRDAPPADLAEAERVQQSIKVN
jgi:hypothetical protein